MPHAATQDAPDDLLHIVGASEYGRLTADHYSPLLVRRDYLSRQLELTEAALKRCPRVKGIGDPDPFGDD